MAILQRQLYCQPPADAFRAVYRSRRSRGVRSLLIFAAEEKPASASSDLCQRLGSAPVSTRQRCVPVAGTLIVEPTESESKVELNGL
ncbi:hypothetical protein ACLK1S_17885 [Escherichia coli]